MIDQRHAFFSVDHEGDVSTHATAEEAQASTVEAVEYLRDNSDSVDESEIACCMWGAVLGHGYSTVTTTIEQATAGGDEDAADLMRRRGWDYLLDVGVMVAQPVVRDVLTEREKQRAKWGDAHDDEHQGGELADAAGLLAFGGSPERASPPAWAYAIQVKNRGNRRQRLVIAAALLLAEIERLDRATAKSTPTTPPTE